MPERKRNYQKEYKDFQGTPEQIKNRAARNKARKEMEAKGAVAKGDGKDVHHKNSNPKDNRPGNLQVKSRSANRSTKGKEW